MNERFTKIEQDVHEMKKDIHDQKTDYHAFKDAYTKNGIELKRLATAIEISQKMDKDQGQKIDAMFEIYQNTGWTFKMIFKLFTAIGITTGMIIGLMKLLNK